MCRVLTGLKVKAACGQMTSLSTTQCVYCTVSLYCLHKL